MNCMSQRILVRSFANTAAGKHKLYKVTPALAKVIGTQETTYRSAVSSVWKHLRESKDKGVDASAALAAALGDKVPQNVSIGGVMNVMKKHIGEATGTTVDVVKAATDAATAALKKRKSKLRAKRAASPVLRKLTPAMSAFMDGKDTASFAQCYDKIAQHISSNNLQTPEDKFYFNLDPALQKLFGKPAGSTMTYVDLRTAIREHVGDAVPVEKPARNYTEHTVKPAFLHILGGKPEASRQMAVKTLHEYLRTNKLKDPSMPRQYRFNSELAVLFDKKEGDTFVVSEVFTMVSRMLDKK